MGCANSTVAKDVEISIPQAEGVKQFHDNYRLGLKIGRGAFAQVRVASYVNRNASNSEELVQKERAVKIVDMRDKNDPDKVCQQVDLALQDETKIWSVLGSHPNCVRLHDVYYGGKLCFMVMDKCSSDLLRHLERLPTLTETHFGQIFRQMLLSLAHVHSCKIIHRDVKPDNFLIGDDGVTIKLCDFGLSVVMSTKNRLGVNGTAPFMCPEMLWGQTYDDTADIWSLGVIAYSCFFGNFPYMPKEASSKAMKQAIVEGTTPKFEPAGRPSAHNPHMRTESAVTFVKTMLARDPEDRPRAILALRLEYIMAVEENRHALGVDLPSLRGMVVVAKRTGAFENRNPSKEDTIDDMLNRLQMEKWGKPIPTPEDKVRHKLSEIIPSHSNSKRTKSNSWENASLSSTCPSTASPIASTPQSASETSTSSVHLAKSTWSTSRSCAL